jgi:hypothetical protein
MATSCFSILAQLERFGTPRFWLDLKYVFEGDNS